MTEKVIESSRLEGKRALTRSNLVKAAHELVLERGHGKISIQDITNRAEVGLGTFYNYFETKKMVFEAVLDEIRDRTNARLTERKQGIPDPATALSATLMVSMQEALENEEWKEFLRKSGLKGEHLLLQDEAICAADIESGRVRGRFKIDNSAFAASLVTGMCQHTVRQIISGKMSTDTIKETVRYILRLLGLPDPVARAIIQAPLPPVAAPRRNHGQREILPYLEKFGG